MYKINCLEENEALFFQADNPKEAMEKCLYYLNIKHKDESAAVLQTFSLKHYYIQHNNKTYAISAAAVRKGD